MPEVIVNVSDAALAASIAGAIPVSRGPGAVPLYDTRFSWDSANRRHTLTGQNASVGGDRWRLQTSGGSNLARWDADGALCHDMTVNSSGFVNRITPQSDAPPITFNTVVGTFNNDPGAPGGNGYNNGVGSIGWNVDSSGGRINLLFPTFRIGLESNYNSGAGIWMEGHAFGYVDPTTGGETRPYSVKVDKTNGYDTQATFQGSSWTWANRAQTTQYATLTAGTDGTQMFTIVGNGGSDINGHALQLISNGGSPQDILTLGRSTATNNQIKLQGAGAVALQINADAGRALIHSTPTVLTLWSPATGGSTTIRTDTLSLVNQASQRFGLRYTDDGQAKIGLLGATPTARETVTGSRGGIAALADLITKLATKGIITDGTTA